MSRHGSTHTSIIVSDRNIIYGALGQDNPFMVIYDGASDIYISADNREDGDAVATWRRIHEAAGALLARHEELAAKTDAPDRPMVARRRHDRHPATPRPGDRVRVTVDGILGTDGKNVLLGEGMALPTAQAVAIEAVLPIENWRTGDVVRAADDPEDRRAWQYNPDGDDDLPWELLGSYAAEAPRYSNRADLPDQLTLIVRNGQLVLPKVTDEDVNAAWNETEGSGDDVWAGIRAGLAVYRERLMGGDR
ncbi:hypothetical protein [Frankia sp. Cj3]|uniref:hypothetical protein n=1 Tax=Frankia sp. Cj3 TaxID=2880976 RepID=UPI001EF6DEB8|nr:hypothetical protein [Frankia sp. Cj3]